MKWFRYPIFVLCLAAFLAAETNVQKDVVLRGWLSDEKCAHARAASGVYTATGPRCARECVATGRKIVFIEPDAKRILLIANQEVAKKYVGDRVEITGSVNPKVKSIHVVSLKMVEEGVAMCHRH